MGRSSEPDKDVVAQQSQPDRSVLDMIMDAPEAVSQAYTGEGVPIEFPNLPELTDMGADALAGHREHASCGDHTWTRGSTRRARKGCVVGAFFCWKGEEGDEVNSQSRHTIQAEG